MSAHSEHIDPTLCKEMIMPNKLTVHVVYLETTMVSLDALTDGPSSDKDVLEGDAVSGYARSTTAMLDLRGGPRILYPCRCG